MDGRNINVVLGEAYEALRDARGKDPDFHPLDSDIRGIRSFFLRMQDIPGSHGYTVAEALDGWGPGTVKYFWSLMEKATSYKKD